jgi:ribosomal protein S18 acetylase RimI-like enzyme
MVAGDVNEVSRLQLTSLDGSMLTELGPRFVRRFHTAQLGHWSTRALVAVDARGTIVGFAVGSVDAPRLSRHVTPVVVPALVWALASRRALRLAGRLLCTLTERSPQPPIAAELLLLAVDARARRRGIGRCLIDALEAEFRQDAVAIYRVSMRPGGAAAEPFYEALGFAVDQHVPVFGEPMTYLIKRIPPRSAGGDTQAFD